MGAIRRLPWGKDTQGASQHPIGLARMAPLGHAQPVKPADLNGCSDLDSGPKPSYAQRPSGSVRQSMAQQASWSLRNNFDRMVSHFH